MDVLAVGTVALDSVETPFGRAENILGGSATYIALASRYLAKTTSLLAVVGYDFPEPFLDRFREADINIDGLELSSEQRTFAWEGRYEYDLNQRETIATHLNALETFNPILSEENRRARIVCLGNLAPGIQTAVLDQLVGSRFVVCDTMNYWIRETPDELRAVLPRIDCLVVNDSECRQLTDEPNLIRAARLIRKMGPDILVVKKGEHGALLFTDSVVFSVPAYPLEDIQDPTGAGDAFMGGFAGSLAGASSISIDALKQAIVYGSALASYTVESFGADRLLELDGRLIQERVDAFRDLTTIPETVLQL
jgi:sugar/nucleoside kinase (ribokinase family)